MRSMVWYILPVFLVVSLSCIEFERFDRIENDRLRVIGVQYGPDADFAPGDTITGKVYFGGDAVTAVGDFSIAYEHRYDKNHYFPDERAITLVDSELWFPDSMQFRYKIPEDVFLKEKVLGDADSATVRRLVGMAENWSELADSLLPALDKDSLENLVATIGGIYARPSLFFTAQSAGGSELKVRSEFIVRYNTLLPGYLPVNRNPEITWIGVFRVPELSALSFDPFELKNRKKYLLTYLYNADMPESVSDTVEIDTGYAYFLACNRGIDTYITSSGDTVSDTTCDFIDIGQGTKVPESYTYRWFFQNGDEVDEVLDSLLLLNFMNEGPGYIEMKLPVFTAMKHFKIWVVVHDEAFGEISRPEGFAIHSAEGVFRYTEAYRKSVE